MKNYFTTTQAYANRLNEKYIQKYVFIHINKTGGSSIEKALSLRHEHRTALEKRNELGDRLWNRKYKFTVVRNPWDKVVSHYHFRLMRDHTGLNENSIGFETWVSLAYGDKDSRYYDYPKMFMPQLDWLVDKDGNMMVDYIGRFECLEEDFKTICSNIKVKKECVLPHLKKSNRGGYRSYYSDQSAQLIAAWFKKDIEYFGYEF